MDLPDVNEAMAWEVAAAGVESRVRTASDMSNEEIAKLEAHYGCRVSREKHCLPTERKAMVHGWIRRKR